ncbi:PREDICTED: thyroid transcription factor 1-associated protein 26-like [Nicrophorus vespilloides]|uniref:Thyroid transcription factor 1-associated protein 26-like n=1 Tax=Nicrophorus vespilloides TaxID=110193 RepID=A0ABM1MWX5_NICVS|nr:PREDICTED: thyroid transcription factor 1-associated protein 26-like [Nicrophorus vespilloides]
MDKRNERKSEKSSAKEDVKKPFNKRLALKKKFSNKYKVEKYQEQRKKHMLRKYKNELKNEKPGFDVSKIYEAAEAEDGDEMAQKPETDRKRGGKMGRFVKRSAEDKEKAQEEFEKRKAEKEEARKEAMEKRKETFKKLNKRTRKGQPSMTGRLEVMYEKIVGMTSQQRSS